MYLRRFSIKNFKIHRDTTLTLFPITVFVGPNGSGKSAIFDALINFSMVCRGNLSEVFNQYPYSFEALRHHGALPSARMRYKAELAHNPESADVLEYQIEFAQTSGAFDVPSYVIHNEELSEGSKRLFSRSDDSCAISEIEGEISGERSILATIRRAHWNGRLNDPSSFVAACAREISSIGRYRLDPLMLARPGRVFDVAAGVNEPPQRAPRLEYRGEDLASVLFFLNETESPILGEITERVAEAIDGFAGFEFNHVGVDRVGFSARFADKRGSVVAPNLSDGCLSMIGLITLALTPGRPRILCVEEPENGLTPKATRVVYRTFLELTNSTEENRSQILMSSHSPVVIVDAWNGAERDFIYQCRPTQGVAEVRPFADAVPNGGGVLRTGGEIGLVLAEQVMDGFRS
jgi:predicted ATPase